MATYRPIAPNMWRDKIFKNLDTSEKLFWVYLLTNPFTKQCGIYNTTVYEISLYSGLSVNVVELLLERFQNQYKLIKYDLQTEEICILNWFKHHQNSSPNVLKCIEGELKEVQSYELVKVMQEGCRVRKIKDKLLNRQKSLKITLGGVSEGCEGGETPQTPENQEDTKRLASNNKNNNNKNKKKKEEEEKPTPPSFSCEIPPFEGNCSIQRPVDPATGKTLADEVHQYLKGYLLDNQVFVNNIKQKTKFEGQIFPILGAYLTRLQHSGEFHKLMPRTDDAGFYAWFAKILSGWEGFVKNEAKWKAEDRRKEEIAAGKEKVKYKLGKTLSDVRRGAAV